MKNAQRRAHRLIWLILPPLLAGMIWLGVSARPAHAPLAGFQEQP